MACSNSRVRLLGAGRARSPGHELQLLPQLVSAASQLPAVLLRLFGRLLASLVQQTAQLVAALLLLAQSLPQRGHGSLGQQQTAPRRRHRRLAVSAASRRRRLICRRRRANSVSFCQLRR